MYRVCKYVSVLCVCSISTIHIAFSVLPIEGQGQFIQPPSDNYDLALDPYQAASSFIMICAYEDANTAFDYTWVKDGVHFQPSIQSFENGVLATVAVPNGDYLSTLEGNYTCRVSLGGATRASRKIIVCLPGTYIVNYVYAFIYLGIKQYHPHIMYSA